MNLNIRAEDFHDGRKGSDQCIIFGTLIPTNEFFIWNQLKLPHATTTTEMVVNEIAEKSGNLKYLINLIDPYANKIQASTGTTVVDDMNRKFQKLKQQGIGTGGFWESWDTKSVFGREELKLRLKNAKECKEPYSNLVDNEDGTVTYLPTVWINRETCPDVIKSVAKWSTDKNGEPAQMHSHFCTAIEAVFKDIRFKARMNIEEFEVHNPYAKYFHSSGRVAV
jgi:hypothetical protein